LKQKKSRNSTKSQLLHNLYRDLILYSIIFIIVWFIFCFGFSYIIEIKSTSISKRGENIQYIDFALLRIIIVYGSGFSLYLIGLVVICFIELIREINKIDRIENSIDGLLNNSIEIKFPQDMSRIEVLLKNIRKMIIDNIKMAKETEDRKNNLVMYLAHDLKTPLTSIIGYISLLAEADQMPIEQRAKYTKITLDKAYRLEELINEFFEIASYNAKSTLLENNKINLIIMLEQLIDEFYPIFMEKGITCELIASQEIKIIADSDKLARLFDNLLKNAVNYSYNNTNIRIEIIKQENFITITFENTGDEIPIEKISHIFEKFYRVDVSRGTKYGGAGLGLAIAKNIVELHNGTIDVKSCDQETIFTVKLPIKEWYE